MTKSTEEVVNHHLQSFGAGDLKEILSDYTEESAIITTAGVLRGLSQLPLFFEPMFAEFAKPGASFAMGEMVVDGETALITWSAETADNVYELGTDSFVVRDGKIVTQTFVVKKTAK